MLTVYNVLLMSSATAIVRSGGLFGCFNGVVYVV